jgi:hypothetical protein
MKTEINPIGTHANPIRFEVGKEYYDGPIEKSQDGCTSVITVLKRTEHFITFDERRGGVQTPWTNTRRKVRTLAGTNCGCEYIRDSLFFFFAVNEVVSPDKQENISRSPEERIARGESTSKQIAESTNPIYEVRYPTDLPEEFQSKYSALTALFSSVKVDALKELHQLLGDYETLSPNGRTRVLVSDNISITYLPMSSVPTSKQRIEAAKGLFYSAIELHPDWRSPKKLRELLGEDILPDGRCVEQWEHLAQVARGSQEDFMAWLDDECTLENVEIAGTSENISNTIRIFKKGNIIAFLKDKGASSCQLNAGLEKEV